MEAAGSVIWAVVVLVAVDQEAVSVAAAITLVETVVALAQVVEI